MMNRVNHIFFAFIVFFLMSSAVLRGQKIEYLKIPELEKILHNPENKLFVLNFWATWCAPCVSEFPGFDKVSKEYDNKNVRFIMVSLDFPSQIENQLIPFLKKNKTSLEIDVMTDLDYNAWISKVDSQWQGEIPATLFFNNSKKAKFFHSGELTEPELRKYINSFL
jgi:thiol-disulfide isomerase/thioredoxin